MRYEPASPALMVLDLLARANSLGAMAEMAIEAGDEDALDQLIRDRGESVDAAIAVWREAEAHHGGIDPGLRARLADAARAAVSSGQQTAAVARLARDLAASELTALDARQHAGQEYLPGAAGGSIDVVL